MKICLINNLYGDFARGGAERIVKLTADGLRARGHEVIIITTRPFFHRSPDNSDRGKIHYFRNWYYYLERLPKVFRFFFHLLDIFDYPGYFRIRAVLRDEKPDLVITHNLMGLGLLAPRAIAKLHLRHIHTLHDIQLLHPSGLMLFGREKIVDSMAAKIYQSICRKLFSCVLIVISPSKWLMDEHEKRGFFTGAKKVILRNPVSGVISKEIGAGGKARDSFKLIYVGQIEKHKGILFLLRAFKQLAKEMPAIQLDIVGGGAEIKRAMAMAGKNDKIKFWGRVDNVAVRKLMAESDCLVCPSLCYENSPAVIYEAISAGLPVIASRIGGITELIYKHGGVLFAPGDGRDLAAKIKLATKNRRLSHGGIKSDDALVDISKIDHYVGKLLSLA